jgi:glucokinase
MSNIIIGVDIGGSHITCMGIDPERAKFSTEFTSTAGLDCQGPAESILQAWTRALSDIISMTGAGKLGGIGFAMPGPFDYAGGVALFRGVKKYDNLYGINIRQELTKRLGLNPSLPVRFLNDATCFAIGESWLGKSSEFPKSMAVTLGTGFGSAFIANGIPVESGPSVPGSGCVYHVPYGRSIADDYFSTRWFLERFYESSGKKVKGVKEMPEEDSCTKAIFQEFGGNLGRFLFPWLLKFNAGCLVIGGNIANRYYLFEGPLRMTLEQNGCRIPVFISSLGEKAAIAGAARLCDDSFYNRLPFNSGKVE